MSSAAEVASQPLSSADPSRPARASACSSVSHVSTPKPTGIAWSTLTWVSVDHAMPVGFGVLTCDTEEQALARAGLEGSAEDKGWEATSAALDAARVVRAIRS